MQILVTKTLSYIYSRSFMVLGFTFKSIIYFMFTFVCVWGMYQSSFNMQICFSTICWKTILSPTNCLCSFVKIRGLHVCGGLFLDSSLFHRSICLGHAISLSLYPTCILRLVIQRQKAFCANEKESGMFQIPWCLPVFLRLRQVDFVKSCECFQLLW